MKNVSVQWLTQDKDLFEVDWLSYLLSDVTEGITIYYDVEGLDATENTILVCNHAVPYRYFLDKLRYNGKKYGIVLLSDENLIDPCEWLHDPACLFCFRNYINPILLGHPKVNFFGLGYKRNFNKVKTIKDSENREYVWSFAGTFHGEREQAISVFEEMGPHKTHSCSGFCAENSLSTEEYSQLLRNTQFALCPVGQDSCDSFRLYEALEAGCIPITQSNSKSLIFRPSYWKGIFNATEELPFVIVETWEEGLDKMKKLIYENKVNETQKACISLWEKYKSIWKKQIEEKSRIL